MAAPLDDKKMYLISGKRLRLLENKRVRGVQNQLDVKRDPRTGDETLGFANERAVYIMENGALTRVLIPMRNAP